jgi:dipeptidyl aminopeptidase/acylaminoacyl peptidase
MNTQKLISAVILTALSCHAQNQWKPGEVEKFLSPDGTITAVVQSTKAREATKESWIELRSQHGHILASRNYRSKDGEHGYGVSKAAWTPDSQFFVYSLESSGGHQAWHTRVNFFSRGTNEIVSLDKALGDAVTNPQFLIAAPDSITVDLMSRQKQTMSLHDITRRLHRSVKSLPRYITDIPQPIPEQLKSLDAPKTVRNVEYFRSFTDKSTMIDVVGKFFNAVFQINSHRLNHSSAIPNPAWAGEGSLPLDIDHEFASPFIFR